MAGRTVPKQVRVVALLVWFLSQNSDMGMSYVLSRGQEYDLAGVDLFSRRHVALFLAAWLADKSVRDALHAGLSALEDQHRTVADQYLLHSLLMEFVIKQNQKGIAIDLTALIAKYIRLWSHRPMTDIMEKRLAKLVWHRGTRRRFGVNLRREWGLCFNRFEDPRDLTTSQIIAKVKLCQLSSARSNKNNPLFLFFCWKQFLVFGQIICFLAAQTQQNKTQRHDN